MGNSKSKQKAGPADDAWLVPQVGDLVDVRAPSGWTVGEVSKRHRNGDISITTNEIGKDSFGNDVYGVTYRLNKAEHHERIAAMGTLLQEVAAQHPHSSPFSSAQVHTQTWASHSMPRRHK